jgi:hypothetical protein
MRNANRIRGVLEGQNGSLVKNEKTIKTLYQIVMALELEINPIKHWLPQLNNRC